MDEKEYNQDVETSGHGEDKDKQKEEDRYEKVCYMCRRPESKAGPMISMPGGMNLCHDCMQKAFDSVTKGGMDFSKLPNMPYMNMNLCSATAVSDACRQRTRGPGRTGKALQTPDCGGKNVT